MASTALSRICPIANLAAEFAAHQRGRLQQFEPATANGQLGAELDERCPTARAPTAGDQYPLSRQQALSTSFESPSTTMKPCIRSDVARLQIRQAASLLYARPEKSGAP
jgi:hypothetical protein